MSTGKNINRRSLITAGIAGVVGLGVGFAGGYFLRPAEQTIRTVEREITRTLERTVTITKIATPAPSEWEALARREGRLEVAGGPPVTFLDAVSKAFKEKYPFLDVSFIRLASGELGTRVEAEMRAGKPTIDVVLTATPSIQYLAFLDRGYLESYRSPWYEKWPQQFVEKGDFGFAACISVGSAFVYNKNLVPANKIPTDWLDILDPWWKGKFGMNDPRIGGGTWWVYYKTIWEPYGEEFWRKLKEIEPFFGSTVALYITKTVAGELAGGYTWDVFTFPQMAQGAPIGVSYLRGTNILNTWHASILKGAPHPNAAKLFIDWLASEEGQRVAVEKGLVWSALHQDMVPLEGLANIWKMKFYTFTAEESKKIYEEFSKERTLGKILQILGLE